MSTKQDWTPEPGDYRLVLTEHGWTWEGCPANDAGQKTVEWASASLRALAGLNPEGVAEAVAALRWVIDAAEEGIPEAAILIAAERARDALEGLGVEP